MTDLDHKISDTKDSLKGLIEIARELEAENARLREALEKLTDGCPAANGGHEYECKMYGCREAREALKNPSERG